MGKKQINKCMVRLLILLFLFSPPACTPNLPSTSLHTQLIEQRIAIVPDPSQVVIATELFARSKPQGALKGAGHGIAEFLGNVNPGSCSGDICGAALLLYAAFAVVVGGTVGAIEGAINASAAKTLTEIDQLLNTNLSQFASNLNLAQRVLTQSQTEIRPSLVLVSLQGEGSNLTAEEFLQLREQGFQKALILKITRFDFVGDKGDNPLLNFLVECDVRVIDAETEETVYQREFSTTGKPRRFNEWLKLSSEKLTAELEEYLDQLAEAIVNGLFLMQKLPISSGSWTLPGTARYGCCWICPADPVLKIRYLPTTDQLWSQVTSRQPRLEWEPFPSEEQQSRFVRTFGTRANAIGYDLRVWEYSKETRGELVYERYALSSPSHRVEEPLKPRSRYLWSFRACFNLGPRTTCSPWAFSLLPATPEACETSLIRAENYYRFAIP
ncbi:hypothetical protein [Malonomonas rubra]|uniref:hypothetical protein n=1 Tax=Malonomonas rubra TaxID=57040 RepID=UPI0026EC09FA|nr:hypothetical protein [Malonomonas rubra]